jgi:NADPH:quinone reductase-like Zn-dependent oxidoreductase
MGLNSKKDMTMRAIVYTKYGSPDVLELKEVAQPVPQDDEVLVKIHAAAANYADWALLNGKPFLVRAEFGLLKPKNTILGADMAGRVEAVGKNVRQFQPGDAVFGDISACGWGGFAEYVAVPEKFLALKPENVTFAQAAAAPLAGITALQGLRDYGHIQPGQKVLINGASGGVGTFAVQIAKAFGAEVTAVCSTSKLEMVRAIGADHAIDYTRENFTRKGQQYDLILGANGQHSLAAYRRALTPQGIYVSSGGTLRQIFAAIILGPLLSRRGGQQLRSMGSAKPSQKDLLVMQEMLATGKVVPVLDRCYPLHEVPDALRYVGEGHAKGKVVIILATGIN